MFFQIATDDSSFLGWLTVAAFLITAVLCGITTLRVKQLFHDEYTCQHQLCGDCSQLPCYSWDLINNLIYKLRSLTWLK
jgi:hypothetical protein